MEWDEMMNQALKYVETHLNKNLSAEELAPTLGCSVYNFQRLFSFITGYSFAYYVRRRIMAEALKDLQKKDSNVTDIALKYGYSTPSTFEKAFRLNFGFSPSESKDEGRVLESFTPLYFHSEMKGNIIMNYSIKKKGALVLSGVSEAFTNVNGENFKAIPEFWAKEAKKGTLEKLYKGAKGVYGVCYNFSTDCTKFSYMIGVAGEKEGFELLKIKPQEYAVFLCHGLKDLQETTRKIFGEWLPSSGYEHADSPELEFYPTVGEDDETMACEIWIPIVKK
jgi:AraC family transcriptional regulator